MYKFFSCTESQVKDTSFSGGHDPFAAAFGGGASKPAVSIFI